METVAAGRVKTGAHPSPWQPKPSLALGMCAHDIWLPI